MSVQMVTTQPGMFLVAPGTKTEMWNSGVCDCCDDMQICCLGLWCPWILACQVSSDFGENCCLPTLDFMCAQMIPAVKLALRSSLRERYRIQGSIAGDCCIAICCSTCSWCQMARELKARHSNTVMINTAVNVTVPPAQSHLLAHAHH